jgi:urease accessory protein
VVCFAGASYRQTQHVELSAGAGLVLVDWFTSGRRAMGERWAFDECLARLTIRHERRLLVHDALSLRSNDGDLRARMHRFEVVCVVAIIGPRLREHAAAVVSRVAGIAVHKRADLLIGASPIRDAGCIVRLAGTSVEAVAHAVREHLRFVPGLLGDDPWARKW